MFIHENHMRMMIYEGLFTSKRFKTPDLMFEISFCNANIKIYRNKVFGSTLKSSTGRAALTYPDRRGDPRACIRHDRSSGNFPWCCHTRAHSLHCLCCTRLHLPITNRQCTVNQSGGAQDSKPAVPAGGVLQEHRGSVSGGLAETGHTFL